MGKGGKGMYIIQHVISTQPLEEVKVPRIIVCDQENIVQKETRQVTFLGCSLTLNCSSSPPRRRSCAPNFPCERYHVYVQKRALIVAPINPLAKKNNAGKT